jgi:hypothetical protein
MKDCSSVITAKVTYDIKVRFKAMKIKCVFVWMDMITVFLKKIHGITSEIDFIICNKNKQTPWSESASELYRPSDSRLSK